MVPNDKVLRDVVSNPETGLLDTLKGVHISCSTIHPDTARELATMHAANGSQYVGAPIFARADGVAARLASFVVGGAEAAVQRALPLLEANSNGIFRFGEDAGAGNVVKLCGNYMIASAIESCSEALSLAEKSGLDRQVFAADPPAGQFDLIARLPTTGLLAIHCYLARPRDATSPARHRRS